MAKWKLTINITKEINALKDLCETLESNHVYEGETESVYMQLAKNLSEKFKSNETRIREITDDDGTWEDLENNLEDLEMSYDVENSNYNLENIYEICDTSRIWLEQLKEA